MNQSINRGFSLIELVVATSLILLLSVVAVPMLDITSQREKEENLRITLNEMRGALDLYLQDHSAYPASIGTLLTHPRNDGFGFYLRRFPLNPIVSKADWEISGRTTIGGVGDVWASCTSAGFTLPGLQPIVDIRCPDYGTAINGINYREW